MSLRRMGLRVGGVLIWLCLLALSGQVLAQGNTIQIGQNAIGTISAANTTVDYKLVVSGGQTAAIQVLGLGQGFMPMFRVLNPAGAEILSAANPAGAATVSGNASFGGAGVYTISVGGANGSTGQFALSLQAGVPLPQATTLVLNQPVSATVDGQTPVQVYEFNTASLGAVGLTILSQTPNAGLLVTLYDEGAGKAIASVEASVLGVSYQLPASGLAYRVEVRADASGSAAFTICIGACGNSVSTGNPSVNGGVPSATPIPAESDTATCTATPNIQGSVNLRSGPGTQYLAESALPVGQIAQVMAVWTYGGWYQVSFNGGTYWLGSTVVTLNGNCNALPRVAAPVGAPLAPTAVPTSTPTPMASPTNLPTDTPTPTNTPENLPDLAVQGMTITQDSPTHARVTFDIYNKGTVDVTQPFYVYVCITALCVEKQITLPVDAGGATEVFVDLNHNSSTTPETVAVAVDSRGEIRESNENNNTTSLADVSLNF
ncbi:MAG TPA: CARDB domain-containing protein [Phototrophicaceae bacterium]|nr:CARDB domain-containing protein [Phototrophicaceae bacterium]